MSCQPFHPLPFPCDPAVPEGSWAVQYGLVFLVCKSTPLVSPLKEWCLVCCWWS